MRRTGASRIHPPEPRSGRPLRSTLRSLLHAVLLLGAGTLASGLTAPAAGWASQTSAVLFGALPIVRADTMPPLQPPRRLPFGRLRIAGTEPLELPPAALPPDSLLVPPGLLAEYVEAIREAEEGARVVVASGQASYYGQRFAGRRTASGERFDPAELTAAHRTLPFGTRVRVTNLRNGRSVVVRINDRGPYAGKRVLDVSVAAARALKMIRSGTAPVRIELLPKESGDTAANGEGTKR